MKPMKAGTLTKSPKGKTIILNDKGEGLLVSTVEAYIWMACDGSKTYSKIAEDIVNTRLHDKRPEDVEPVVKKILDKLQRNKLITY